MEQEDEVVNTPVTEETPEVIVPEDTKLAVQPGDKTEPNLLLKSLREEREKRRLAEEEKRLLEEQLKINSSSVPEEAFSDEGKLLERKFNAQVESLASQLAEVKTESLKKDVLAANPILKEKWEDFEAFTADPENKGMSLKTAAKAFLVENGLLETKRKGLEKPTGGTRTPAPAGMTAADVKTLRETDFKKYQEMLVRGEIKFAA